jgi:hypothetical protein
VMNITPRPLYTLEQRPGTYRTRHRSGQEQEILPHRGLNSGPFSTYRVAMPTTLSRPTVVVVVVVVAEVVVVVVVVVVTFITFSPSLSSCDYLPNNFELSTVKITKPVNTLLFLHTPVTCSYVRIFPSELRF